MSLTRRRLQKKKNWLTNFGHCLTLFLPRHLHCWWNFDFKKRLWKSFCWSKNKFIFKNFSFYENTWKSHNSSKSVALFPCWSISTVGELCFEEESLRETLLIRKDDLKDFSSTWNIMTHCGVVDATVGRGNVGFMPKSNITSKSGCPCACWYCSRWHSAERLEEDFCPIVPHVLSATQSVHCCPDLPERSEFKRVCWILSLPIKKHLYR